MLVETGSGCVGLHVKYTHYIFPGAIGEVAINLAPGLVVPKGDALCAAVDGSVGAAAQVSGYTVSATDAPA